MKVPSQNTSTPELRKLHVYTLTRVGADEATHDMGDPLKAVWSALEAADAHYLER